jgi:adenylate cyclase
MLTSAVQGLSLTDAAAQAGIDAALVDRAQRALGLPPTEDSTYDETALANFAAASQLFGTDVTLQFSRVLGSALARIVEAAMSVFAAELEHDPAPGSELDLAHRAEGATALLLSLPETMSAVFPAFVADALRRVRLTSLQPSGGAQIAVGFVDLVGSTRLAQQMSGRELANAVNDFESAAYDLALTYDGRVVKFVGDEAMFVHSDPAGACAAALDLRDMVAGHPLLTAARCAVNVGEAIAQDGDYYGSTVNLAARLTSVAGPGELLATLDVQLAVSAMSSDLVFRPAGSHALRGYEQPVEAVSVHRT